MPRPAQLHLRGPTLALLFGILAGSALAIPIGNQGTALPRTPGDPRALARKLSAREVRLYYVEHWSGTVYLTEEPRPIEELFGLLTGPAQAAKWKGVVRFVKIPEGFSESLNYGEFGFRLGDSDVYGDPALLRQIRDVAGHD
jgi:hypothetical protein